VKTASTKFQISVPVQPGNSGGALLDAPKSKKSSMLAKPVLTDPISKPKTHSGLKIR